MSERFEVRWEGELPAAPREVWDAFTVHTAGWYWKIAYEPWVGGAERGLTSAGTVTVWDPPRHFTTRSADGSNELDYVLEPSRGGTFLSYRHRGETTENHERELDACRRHTAFYYHSLGEYLRHFSGRDAAYVSAEAPDSSAKGGFAVLRQALGVPEDVAAGDTVRLTPAGMEPIDGVVDYATATFLGVRGDDALYRFYGRDVWDWPVGVAHHMFVAGADEAELTQTWSTWLDGVFAKDVV
ncbi:SRPBCC domain-containing protein [Nonomuraea cavernae]|nr:SRPBCC domain-containing protein [Nonomuraea cavernae]MCA2190838.1 SRPBCC domain-containing protein [Nonomuraea cavernae]